MITEFIVYTIIVSILIISLIGCGTFENRDRDEYTGIDIYTFCEGDCKCITKVKGKGRTKDTGHSVKIDTPEGAAPSRLDLNK